MKHFNVLKWHVNLILKHCLAFKCLIIKRNYKGHGMTTKKVLLFETTHSFYGWPKTMIKTWNKIFHSTIVLFHITFKSKCETNDKAALVLGLGKSSISNPEKIENVTHTSQIFFKLSLVVGIIKTRQSWKFELVTPSGLQNIAFLRFHICCERRWNCDIRKWHFLCLKWLLN